MWKGLKWVRIKHEYFREHDGIVTSAITSNLVS